MKRDRVKESERGETETESSGERRGKKCVTSRQMHRPWEIRLRYHIVIAAGYICRSVGRSAGRSVAVVPNGKKEKTRLVYCTIRETESHREYQLWNIFRHKNYN